MSRDVDGRTGRRVFLIKAAGAGLAACTVDGCGAGSVPGRPDASRAGGRNDGSAVDGSMADTGASMDAGTVEGGASLDGGVLDTGAVADGGTADSATEGGADGGATGSSATDGGATDSSVTDSAVETGSPEAGSFVCSATATDTGDLPSVFAVSATAVPALRCWVMRDSGGLYALASQCTHDTTCAIMFETTRFLCPCHQATFTLNGAPSGGPALVPLPHYALCLTSTGTVAVDTSTMVAPTQRYPF